MSLVSGKDFNKMFNGKQFYKLLNKNLVHNGFVFQDGLNVDTQPFTPFGQCCAGGLYFADKEHISLWMEHKHYICEVYIPDDSQVYIENNKYKTNAFVLKNKKELVEWEEWSNIDYCKGAVQQNGFALQYVKQITQELGYLAVVNHGAALQYIPYHLQTPFLCETAVKNHGWALQFVCPELQTQLLCEIAVKNNGLSLAFVKMEYKCRQICEWAVLQDGMAFYYVSPEYMTVELFEMALQQNGFALQLIKPECQTPVWCQMAIQQNILAEKYIFKP